MNTSTEIDRIHRQHMEAIDNTLASRRHDLALMISFSLHLALQDLADKLRPSYGADLNAQIIRLTEWLALNVENQDMASVDLAIHEIERQRTALATYQAEIDRLQEDTNAEVAELRQQLAQLDADNAAMIRRNKQLADDLRRSQERTDAVSELATIHANGAAPSTINNQIPLDYSSLSSENVDWCDGLDAGRQQWRSLPKQTRLELVRWILSHNDAMTMATFDNIRPGWMPTAGTHTKVFNMTWEQLNDFTVDLEVTR